MSDVVHWTYLPIWKPKNLSNEKILSAIRFAANEWNLCMKGLVELKEGSGNLQIRISFDNKIDKKLHPNRIAECRTFKNSDYNDNKRLISREIKNYRDFFVNNL